MRSFQGGRYSRSDAESQPKVEFQKTYGRLLKYAKPYTFWILVILIASLASAFMSVLPAQVMGVAIDKIFEGARENEQGVERPAREAERAQGSDEPSFRPRVELPITPHINAFADWVAENWMRDSEEKIVSAVVLVLAFLLLFAASRVLGVVQGYIMARVGQSLVYDMRSQVYDHMQRLSVGYFENQKTGDVMSRVVNDVNSLEQVIVGPVVSLITDICRLVWVLYFCLTWDWQLTLMAMTAVPLLLISTYIIGRMLRKNFRELRTKVGELNALLQDNISGIRVVKSFAREEHELNRFNEKSRENYTLNVRIATIFVIFRPWIDMLNQIGMLAVLGIGSVRAMSGAISPGMFVVFIQYLPMVFGPITGFTRYYNHVQQALASSERVFELLDTEPQIALPKNPVSLPKLSGRVEFQNVSFAYQTGGETLRNIDLSAEPGEMIALVGPSGAGKTTLVNLIPRFYDPINGVVLIDGMDLRWLDLTEYRRQIGLVSQDPFLFNDTVENNLRYGRLDATDEDLREAAAAANAAEFIEDMPEGYKTEIGERGVKLSGGQRQRLSIARAILADARILILDEATSAVDSETEALIQQAVDNLVKNRTTFVIAHRLSTIRHADQILTLENGQIVERGSHEELIAQNGVYTRLHKMQFRDVTPKPSPPSRRRGPRPGAGGGEGRPPFRGQINIEDDLI